MGYRSEVAYVINFEDKETRDEYVSMVLVHGGLLAEALGECEVEEDNPHSHRINFHAFDVKWYDSYEDVKAHHRLMEWAKELYPEKCDWKFVRIGESIEDIQDEDSNGEWTPYDDFYPCASMTIPFSHQYKSFKTTREESQTS